jgi:hypothetical protein
MGLRYFCSVVIARRNDEAIQTTSIIFGLPRFARNDKKRQKDEIIKQLNNKY